MPSDPPSSTKLLYSGLCENWILEEGDIPDPVSALKKFLIKAFGLVREDLGLAVMLSVPSAFPEVVNVVNIGGNSVTPHQIIRVARY